MEKTNKTPSKLIRYAKVKLFFFASVSLIIGILTPHLFDGHLFIEKEYAQSTLIFLDFILIFFFIQQYLKDLEKIDKHRKYANSLLDRSHKHLGLTNRKISVLTDFINIIPEYEGQINPKEIINNLIQHILVSVLRVPSGKLRIINKETLRTVKEWNYGSKKSIRGLSNQTIANNNLKGFNQNYRFILSDYGNYNILCALIFPSTGDSGLPEDNFTRTLLNQICSIIFQLEILNSKFYNSG